MRIWSWLARVWLVLGLVAFIGIITWCLLVFRASSDARGALQSDEQVKIERGDGFWVFVAKTGSKPASVGLLFFPGSLVEPAAYAPLAHAVARKG